jgi:hypothetical protein
LCSITVHRVVSSCIGATRPASAGSPLSTCGGYLLFLARRFPLPVAYIFGAFM